MSHVPTIADLLQATDIGNGLHHWRVEGGVIQLTQEQLIPALEAAYDPFMENWPAMVEAEIETWIETWEVRATAHGAWQVRATWHA